MAIIVLHATILFLAFTVTILLFKKITTTSTLPPKSCLPPGPKPWPIIGNISIMIRNKPFFRWVHDTMSKMGYEIFCIRLGSVHVIAVTSPEIACEFLKKQDENYMARPTFLSAELASGGFSGTIFTTVGDQWRKMKRKDDLLDVLITLKDDQGNTLLTSEEIKAQILEIMVATIDNPSNAVEWAIAEMINQPETLVRAVQELDQVVGKNRLVQESDLNNLNYIKACVKESFRLHPIVAFNLPHVSICDTMVAGYFIPKGSHILLSRPGLGRNSKIWNEPLRFNPERHLNYDGSHVILNDPDLHLLSFSIGRRGCPAVNLGSTISIMLLARLLQGFTWSPPPNTTCIKLLEAIDEMSLSNPLLALASPRLDERLYACIT
ncbi:tyrosine N-monooxygenase-like [Impatiens glandulifera]|uniref:tyrosine N-monooxygenase-like n=1 Tax=Impatiens glandulifera TaxID=253017 RepID=UPI001FB16D01|nr:tyrosine N-monooxygenase-like [Impatiens glandulifera]